MLSYAEGKLTILNSFLFPNHPALKTGLCMAKQPANFCNSELQEQYMYAYGPAMESVITNCLASLEQATKTTTCFEKGYLQTRTEPFGKLSLKAFCYFSKEKS